MLSPPVLHIEAQKEQVHSVLNSRASWAIGMTLLILPMFQLPIASFLFSVTNFRKLA
jgi:hypothetical protein